MTFKFFLLFLKFSKGHLEVFVHVLSPEEVDSSLVDFAHMSKTSMPLFKPSKLDPVLHGRVHEHKALIKGAARSTSW